MDCFVLGAYAALRLGPGGANLMGARTAAVRVSSALKGNLASSCSRTRPAGGARGGSKGSCRLGVGKGGEGGEQGSGASSSDVSDVSLVACSPADQGECVGTGLQGACVSAQQQQQQQQQQCGSGGSCSPGACSPDQWLQQLQAIIALNRSGRDGKVFKAQKSGRRGMRSK